MAQKPVRVLYVEDQQEVQWVISELLTMLGYEVACADNGRQGIEIAKSWRPNVILMDVRMPVMSGPEAVQILRRQPETASIPILALSAFSDAKTRDECKQAGVDEFLTKPVSVSRLDQAIQQAIKQAV